MKFSIRNNDGTGVKFRVATPSVAESAPEPKIERKPKPRAARRNKKEAK